MPPILDLEDPGRPLHPLVAHKACVDAKTVELRGPRATSWSPRREPTRAGQEYAALITDWFDLCARRDDKTFEELLTAARKDEEAVGFGAIEISRNGNGMIDGLFHVHAYTLRRRKARDGWVQNVDGAVPVLPPVRQAAQGHQGQPKLSGPNEILVIGETSPDSPFYPMPDHTPALGDIAGDEAAQAYQLQFFKNNAVPRIAICVDGGKLDPETEGLHPQVPAPRASGARPTRLLLLRDRAGRATSRSTSRSSPWTTAPKPTSWTTASG